MGSGGWQGSADEPPPPSSPWVACWEVRGFESRSKSTRGEGEGLEMEVMVSERSHYPAYLVGVGEV